MIKRRSYSSAIQTRHQVNSLSRCRELSPNETHRNWGMENGNPLPVSLLLRLYRNEEEKYSKIPTAVKTKFSQRRQYGFRIYTFRVTIHENQTNIEHQYPKKVPNQKLRLL